MVCPQGVHLVLTTATAPVPVRVSASPRRRASCSPRPPQSYFNPVGNV
jgi:hypothetical protein